MNTPTEQAQRWVWFVDVVFGAIVALGIEKYEPVVRAAWAQGLGALALSLFVALSVCSFVVYDIAVYHALTRKFPYQLTTFGFVRFFLDLVMAFLLYVLLANALRNRPDWVAILAAISLWHLAAVLWHLLARREHDVVGALASAIVPHVVFVGVYWLVAFLAGFVGARVGVAAASSPSFVLVCVCVTILFVSLFRWNQVIRKVAV